MRISEGNYIQFLDLIAENNIMLKTTHSILKYSAF